jgi:hypothetical protein
MQSLEETWTMKSKGTTFTLPPDTVARIERLRRMRHDTTMAATIRFLLLRALHDEGIFNEASLQG